MNYKPYSQSLKVLLTAAVLQACVRGNTASTVLSADKPHEAQKSEEAISVLASEPEDKRSRLDTSLPRIAGTTESMSRNASFISTFASQSSRSAAGNDLDTSLPRVTGTIESMSRNASFISTFPSQSSQPEDKRSDRSESSLPSVAEITRQLASTSTLSSQPSQSRGKHGHLGQSSLRSIGAVSRTFSLGSTATTAPSQSKENLSDLEISLPNMTDTDNAEASLQTAPQRCAELSENNTSQEHKRLSLELKQCFEQTPQRSVDTPTRRRVITSHQRVGSLEALKQYWQQQSQAHNQPTTTHELVAAYNSTHDAEERRALQRWLQAYVLWFKDQDIPIPAANIEQYAALALISAKKSGDKDMLRKYFSSLANKINPQYVHGQESVIQLLSTVLPVLDPTIFKGQSKELLQLHTKLCTQIKRLQVGTLNSQNYPAHRNILKTLYYLLDLSRKVIVADAYSDGEDEEDIEETLVVYSWTAAKSRLVKAIEMLEKTVAASAAPAAYVYQLMVIKKALKALDEPSVMSSQDDIVRLTQHTASAMQRLAWSNGVSLLFDYSHLHDKDEKWRAVLDNEEALSKQTLYDKLSTLHRVVLSVLQDVQNIDMFERSLGILSRIHVDESPSIDQETLVLCYGIVEQIVNLSQQSKAREVSIRCQQWLSSLQQEKKWQHRALQQILKHAHKTLQQSQKTLHQDNTLYKAVLESLQLEGAQAAMQEQLNIMQESLADLHEQQGGITAQDIEKQLEAMKQRLDSKQVSRRNLLHEHDASSQDTESSEDDHVGEMCHQRSMLTTMRKNFGSSLRDLGLDRGSLLREDSIRDLFQGIRKPTERSQSPGASPRVASYRRWLRTCEKHAATHAKKHNLPALSSTFVGREDALVKLYDTLRRKEQAFVAITGAAGKTSLAQRYAHWQLAQGHQYDLVWQLSGVSPWALAQSYQQLAAHLDIETLGKSVAQIKQAVFAALQHQGCWLLIVENVDTTAMRKQLEDWLPLQQPGHILVTSQLREGWREAAFCLNKPAATTNLWEAPTTDQPHTIQEAGEASQALATLLDHSPLAIYHAKAFMKNEAMHADIKQAHYRAYTTRYQQAAAEHASLLNSREAGYKARLAILLNLQQVRAQNPEALACLQTLAYLRHGEYLPQGLVDACGTKAILGLLQRYALLRSVPEKQSYQLNRLVTEVALCVAQVDADKYVSCALEAVKWVWQRYDRQGNFPKVGILIPHLEALSKHSRCLKGEAYKSLATLLTEVAGYYQCVCTDYPKAIAYQKRAHKMLEEFYEYYAHDDLAESYLRLGELCSNQQALLPEAEQHIKCALKICLALHQEQPHRNTARSHLSLGQLYCKQSRYEQGKASIEKALAIYARVEDKSFRVDVAKLYAELGAICCTQKDFKQAEQHHLKALRLRKMLYGLQPHADLAHSYDSLGFTYGCLQDFRNAKIYYCQNILQKIPKDVPKTLWQQGACHDRLQPSWHRAGLSTSAK